MIKVYVAGQYSRNPNGQTAEVLEIAHNIHAGMQATMDLMALDFAVYCPWLDFQLAVMNAGVNKQYYYNNSMAWLEVSDVVLVISGAGFDGGVDKEIVRAKELGIPVFYTLEELLAWKETKV